MKEKITQQNNEQPDEILRNVLIELSRPPNKECVSKSFSEMMQTVTSTNFARIPKDASKKDVSLMHPKNIMRKVTKISAIVAPIMAVVIIMVYVALPDENMEKYNDIILAGLTETDFQQQVYQDDMNDITEEPFTLEESFGDMRSSAQKDAETEIVSIQDVSTEVKTETGDIETLLVFDDIFLDADIDDTDLNTWFADDSATDALFENYDI